MDLYKNEGEFIPDKLFASNQFPVITEGITLLKGQGVLVRGTVLGVETTSGIAKIVDSENDDGTQTACAILTDDVEVPEDSDLETTVYVTGCFNSDALIFGGSDTAATHKHSLRNVGIYLK